MYTDGLDDTIRKALAKSFGKGNKFFSYKKVSDTVKYLAYMIKEGDLQGNVMSYDPELLKQASEYDAQVKKDLKAKKEKGPVWQMIMNEMEAKGETDWSPANVTRYVIYWNKRETKLVREFFMVSTIQTILLQKNEDYSIQLESSLMDKVTKVYM